MSQHARPNGPYAQPYKSTDSAPPAMSSSPIKAKGYATLAAGTYYWQIGGESSPIESIHVQFDATVAGVFTIEDSNHARKTDANGTDDVSVLSATTGDWIPENPTSGAYVGVAGGGVSAVGATVTVVATAGGGGFMLHVGNFGSRALRLKAVLTAGGECRVSTHGKM